LKSTGATLTALGAAGALAATLGLATILPGIGVGILVSFLVCFWKNIYLFQVAGLIALGISIAGGVKKRAEQRQCMNLSILLINGPLNPPSPNE
jgi:hypothetical protein